MGRVSDFFEEWKARRAGRMPLDSGIRRSARDIGGPSGILFSSGWDAFEDKGEKYVESLEPQPEPIPLHERILDFDKRSRRKCSRYTVREVWPCACLAAARHRRK